MLTGMEEILSLQQMMFACLTVQRYSHTAVVFCIRPNSAVFVLSHFLSFFPLLFSFVSSLSPFVLCSPCHYHGKKPLKHLVDFSLTEAVIGF